MTTTAATIKDSSKVSGSNDFNKTIEKNKGLGGFEAISLEKYDTPYQKESDEHGDLTEMPSNKKSDKKVKVDIDSNTVETLHLWDLGNPEGTTGNFDTDKPAKKETQGKEQENKEGSVNVL